MAALPLESDSGPDKHPAIVAREKASVNSKKQAEKMVNQTNKKLGAFQVGDCVMRFLPEFDRGGGDAANMVGVVLKIKDDKYQLSTRSGIIETWFTRNGFELSKFRGLASTDIPDETLSIRETVREQSVGTGQGCER